MSPVVDIDDPADPRLDDFRDLNSVDRRPDLPSGNAGVAVSTTRHARHRSPAA
jgi:hypothetical protein